MHLKANGITMNVEIDGFDRAPPVVLSHSLLTSLRAWDAVAADLATDFRVIRYDLRGHGDTEAPAGAYAMGQLADDVVALLDSLDIERAHFVGLSIGGMLGMEFAGHHPDRVNRLVLAACGPKTPPEGAAQWQARIDEVAAGGIETQIAPFLSRWFTDSAEPAVIAETAALMRATPVAGFVGCCEAIKHHDAMGLLSEITAPTLVLTGSKDPGATPAVGDLIAARIKGAVHETIADSAHQIALQRPEAFTASVRKHLSAD